MSGEMTSPDGKWVWDGNEWIPNTQTEIQMSDSVIGGDVISNQNVNSVDSEVVKAAMTGVVEALKELHPITQVAEPQSNPESTRLKELEMETYLLEEKKRLKGIDRKRAYYRKKSRKRKINQIMILIGLTIAACYYIITNNISI
tara:strand:- start:13 stop:444 length:432 start_codon:yes stop_codon:yes gene_type:complete